MQRTAPSYGFGTSKRPKSHNPRQQKPGPGAYEMRGIVGTENQGKSLGMKLLASKTSKLYNPGPGQYNPMFSQSVKAQPGWKIGTSKRGEEERAERKRNYPPPDSYNPDMSASKSRQAAWRIGTSLRDDMAKGNRNPGPNNYEIFQRRSGPSYGMALKLDN